MTSWGQNLKLAGGNARGDKDGIATGAGQEGSWESSRSHCRNLYKNWGLCKMKKRGIGKKSSYIQCPRLLSSGSSFCHSTEVQLPRAVT